MLFFGPTPWHPVKIEGLPLVLIVVTAVITFFAAVTTALRVYVKRRQLAVEDYLMCFGCAVNIISNAFFCRAATSGLGTHENTLEMAQLIEMAKYMFLFEIFFLIASTVVKASICVLLIRLLSYRRAYIYYMYFLIILTTGINFSASVIILNRCHPIPANWDPGLGTCAELNVLTVPGWMISGASIITDFSVAIFPISIVRRLQMPRKTKLSLAVVLGLGISAAVATAIRLGITIVYTTKIYDYAYIGGPLLLCSVIESSIGVIAGSLPILRTLVKGLRGPEHQGNCAGNAVRPKIVTIGQLPGRPRVKAEPLSFNTASLSTTIVDEEKGQTADPKSLHSDTNVGTESRQGDKAEEV